MFWPLLIPQCLLEPLPIPFSGLLPTPGPLHMLFLLCLDCSLPPPLLHLVSYCSPSRSPLRVHLLSKTLHDSGV